MQSILRTLTVGFVLALLVPNVSLTGQGTDTSKPKMLQGEIGTWKLNLAKSKYNPASLAPKSITATRALAGQSVKVTTKGIDAQGNPTATEATVTYDGKDYPVAGNPNWDTASAELIDAFRANITRKKGGKVVQTGTFVISKDGKVITITAKGTDAQGRQINNVSVWEKQ